VKLYRQLSKRDARNVLYIPDEPTTGMHFHDVSHLFEGLPRLRDHGNTVVAIEHSLDAIKTAGRIIAPGPEDGNQGGEMIVTGTPEDVSRMQGGAYGEVFEEGFGGILVKTVVCPLLH
jgi:excinuclease ABC subunit A